MSITENEAQRVTAKVLYAAIKELGPEYYVTVSHPRVGDYIKIVVHVQISETGGRLAPMAERYLKLCDRYPQLDKEWLNSEVQMDDKTLIVIGAESTPTAYAIILRDKLQGANGFAGYHVNAKQLVKLMGDK